MNAHPLKEAVPTLATTPPDHLLVPVQLVWSWILEKEVAKVKLEFPTVFRTPFLSNCSCFYQTIVLTIRYGACQSSFFSSSQAFLDVTVHKA